MQKNAIKVRNEQNAITVRNANTHNNEIKTRNAKQCNKKSEMQTNAIKFIIAKTIQ